MEKKRKMKKITMSDIFNETTAMITSFKDLLVNLRNAFFFSL
jgi:hypothetical protein